MFINTTYGDIVLNSLGGQSVNGKARPALKGFIAVKAEDRAALAEAILNAPVKTDKKDNEVIYLDCALYARGEGKFGGQLTTSVLVKDEAPAEQPA